MIKAVIFDCFGVIISDALEVMVAEIIDEDPDIASRIIATINAASRGMISREESTVTVAELFGISVDEYKSRMKRGEVKNQKVLDYAVSLRGKYKTALLSNVGSRGLEVRFTPQELDTCFDIVVASADIGFAKPETRAYEITAEKLGVPPSECIMIDDREDYCQGATRVGMSAILFNSFEQMKGELEQII